jgi:lipoyl(octanoyl) transferase
LIKDCLALWLGRVAYPEALDLQMRLSAAKKQGYARDVLLLLEHPPTITMGRNARREHLLVSPEQLKRRGIGLCEVDRGGDITFHGPGQLVGYPILLLEKEERDIRRYMRNLEESLIRLLAGYGIQGSHDSGFIGVWTAKGKIGALGVHISRWITRHGFALNVNTDMSFYSYIVPCGITGRGVSSMSGHLSRTLDLSEVAERYMDEFGVLFKRKMIRIDRRALEKEALVNPHYS